ncbi:hypothetical protein IWQ62_001365 [Dispira parvispora]|uniref:N-acetylglucosaminylphosphatidylinositol deacetylase n=1 Tax=Dispira parvispora TaxID=1520584 RepID=A0A9W8AY48_9FUNG|nr:hypothetical protein IWQ62_001365 [Dispira parvispora]
MGTLSACAYLALVFRPPRITSAIIPVSRYAKPLSQSDATTSTEDTPESGATEPRQRTNTGKAEDKAPLLSTTPPTSLRRALLVIAHPDDECMFFGPLLTALQRWQSERTDDPHPNVEVHVLCLSAGNYDKKGGVRKVELVRSCQALGIAKENIVIVDDPALPDNPKKVWNVKMVAKLVEKCVVDRGIGSVFTFDMRGVSGHMNHIAVYLGVQHMLGFSRKVNARTLPCYRLVSVSLFRKYVSLFDSLFSLAIATQPDDSGAGLVSTPDYLLFVAHWRDVAQARNAMQQHQSQMIWFRHLYILFSRYMVINGFERMK